MLSFEKFDFIFVAINLVILYFFMRKLLFKPVTEFMEKRSKGIQDSLDSAEKDKAVAAELKKKYEEQLNTAKAEADKILEEARARASRECDSIISEARKNSELIISKARDEIEREREQSMKDIKSQVAGLALAAASKVIEANMDTEGNRALVDKFIDRVGAA
ncbi:ATP synthase F0 subcomplex B subunit [Anaerobacterium chartisolvens]|uniref:ATP synthase subunit b n=1 Tax=Anaerobacterium chartisolvens TaxID=1297424 RepID=A0A369AY28_9FIRM|nr:F0F1 ATP synthase subunit B [Anaerobacterium chartisolvens]RCX14320.1 ATP synthase F0 subcomplex B subunit [Anaerobacterium chartisolvens]